MCYVCAKSSRIMHINQCSHIKNTPRENRIFFVGDKELEDIPKKKILKKSAVEKGDFTVVGAV